MSVVFLCTLLVYIVLKLLFLSCGLLSPEHFLQNWMSQWGWPLIFGCNMSSHHHFIWWDICVKYQGHHYRINWWDMANTVTLTFDFWTIKFKPLLPWVQVDSCTKFEDIPSKHSWDITFKRIDGQRCLCIKITQFHEHKNGWKISWHRVTNTCFLATNTAWNVQTVVRITQFCQLKQEVNGGLEQWFLASNSGVLFGSFPWGGRQACALHVLWASYDKYCILCVKCAKWMYLWLTANTAISIPESGLMHSVLFPWFGPHHPPRAHTFTHL